MKYLILVFGLFCSCSALRTSNQLGLFNVVQFKNDVCEGEDSLNRNGTCYTQDECDDRGGISSGTCASGYGVCCIIMLECGAIASDNCTYLVQTSTSKPPTGCTYTICPASKNICRMKFDFIKFDIAGPNSADLDTSNDGVIGDCADDAFVVGVSGTSGSPTICGTNAKQHVYVDVSNNQCAKASFVFGTGSTTSRQYDIKVLQFECQDEMGGPPGCLQYHTATSGVVATFNYPIGSTSLTTSGSGQTTHLGEQVYSICIRRAEGYCSICYTPSLTSPTSAASFGVSATIGTATKASLGTQCSTDYIVIREAVQTATIANTMTGISFGTERICGRVFSTIAETAAIAYAAGRSICSGARPFRIEVKFDQNEVSTATTDDTTTEHGISNVPNGIIGFSLDYVQQKCT